MVEIELKGIHTVKSKGRVYYYAWRGGPALKGLPGTFEFMKSYNEAIAERQTPDDGKFMSIVTHYKKHEFVKLAPSTRRVWAPWVDRVAKHFGVLSIAQFNRPEKIRPRIIQWRSQYAETPRSADFALQVLSRILSHAVDPMGKLASNPCEGIRHLYSGSRAEIIWTESDILQLKTKASAEVAFAVDLAAHTGLRVGDLVRLSWSHVGEDAIVISTGKSKHRKEAVIPRYDALNELLEKIPKRSPVILTNSRKRPWTQDGLASSFWTAKVAAGMQERDLHFHDLRGTAATKFYIAGLKIRVIAEIMAWEEDQVEKIIRRYVSRGSATKEAIRQLNDARQKGFHDAGVRKPGKEQSFVIAENVREAAIAVARAGGGVYFVRAAKTRRIKIGVAASPLARMLELSTGSSEELTLAAVLLGNRECEAYLHQWFKDHRKRGEWFEENPILTDLISAASVDPGLDFKAWLDQRNMANVVIMERDGNR